MDNTNQKIIDKLNHLIGIAADGKHGYEHAAKDVEDEALKLSFQLYAEERSGYVKQLQQHVNLLGGKAEDDDGGPVGMLHRTWMDLKSAVTSGDKEAIIDACITGEEAAVKEYAEAIIEPYITGELDTILCEQEAGIKHALKSIKLHIKAE